MCRKLIASSGLSDLHLSFFLPPLPLILHCSIKSHHSQWSPHPKAPTKTHAHYKHSHTQHWKINIPARTGLLISDSNQKHFNLKHLSPACLVCELWERAYSLQIARCGAYPYPDGNQSLNGTLNKQINKSTTASSTESIKEECGGWENTVSFTVDAWHISACYRHR